MAVLNGRSAHWAASAWIKYSSSARRTCGGFFPPMRRITIRRARTWHYTKMRLRTDRSNDLAPLSAFRSWLDCTINTSGCNFRKGQVARANKRFVETKTLEAAELPDTPSHAPALHPPADFGDKCHPRIGTSRRASR